MPRGGNNRKTLAELQASGTFRADRHSHLLTPDASEYDPIRDCLHNGPPPILAGNGNPTDADLAQAWERRKRSLLAAWIRPTTSGNHWDTPSPAARVGRRPWAWWRWDSPDPMSADISVDEHLEALGFDQDNDVDQQRAYLLDRGLLTVAEQTTPEKS